MFLTLTILDGLLDGALSAIRFLDRPFLINRFQDNPFLSNQCLIQMIAHMVTIQQKKDSCVAVYLGAICHANTNLNLHTYSYRKERM